MMLSILEETNACAPDADAAVDGKEENDHEVQEDDGT